MQTWHNKLRDFLSRGFFLLAWKHEANLCARSDEGKEGFRDYHCRTRDSMLTRVFRDHEFIATPVLRGFSPALRCSATPEKATRKMDGWVQSGLRFSQTIVTERPSDNSINRSDKWQENKTRSHKTNV